MNRKIGMAGAAVNAATVLCFAVFMLFGWTFASYFVCIFLSLSYICMTAAFSSECTEKTRAAGTAGLAFAAVYSTLIVIVYFTQCTTVMNEELQGDALKILDYRNLGLMFNLDLLGYGIMALSTFFVGLAVNVRNKRDKILRILLMAHGLFFPPCIIMPMTGMFLGSSGSSGGVIALEIWCLYFLPIGLLSYLHFKDNDRS